MFRAMVAVGFVLMLASCKRDGQKQQVESATGPNGVTSVDLLFIHDGVKVYRFYDGRSHYFTVPVRPGERTEAITTWSESCGKNCTRQMADAIVWEAR